MNVRWEVVPGGPLRGSLRVPGDKSISHRALLLNGLASGSAVIRNLLRSEDVDATAGALRAMGVEIEEQGDTFVVRPPVRLKEPEQPIDCGNSGTSMRLLSGVIAAEPMFAVLTGDASLRRRPMARVLDPLRQMGAEVGGRGGGRLAPLAIRGGQLRSMDFSLNIASAQVKSALLLAGRRVGVSVEEPEQSRNHTELMLARMGASLEVHGRRVVLGATEKLEPLNVDVPGDISAAAFFLVAGCIVPGSEICLRGVGVNPTRTGILDILRAMGADIEIVPVDSAGAEPQADLIVRSSSLKGIAIGGTLALRALDELPVAAVAAAFAEGDTVMSDAAELRAKESDRVARTVAGLRTLGIDAEERPDGMVIRGGRPCGPGLVDANGDHRIAMAFSVAALACEGGVWVDGAESVASSYPGFRDHLEGLRA